MQLVVIGATVTSVHNDIFNKTYECNKYRIVPEWFGALFPLAVFVPEDSRIKEYCGVTK